MKKCCKCKEEKQLSEFNLDRAKKDGYRVQCRACVAVWRANSKERIAAYNKVYNKVNKQKNHDRYENNKAYVSSRQKVYYEKNKDVVLARNKLWAERNKDRYAATKRAAELRRRANQVENGIYHISYKFFIRLYSSPCINCGSKDNIQADHIIPVSRGGRHSEGNLQPLCAICNNSKHARTMTEWKLLLQKSGA